LLQPLEFILYKRRMVQNIQQRGVLRVVSPGELDKQVAAEDKRKADAAALPEIVQDNLAQHIRTQFDMMVNARDSTGVCLSERLLAALRAFNGQYDPTQLAEIKKFGGSEVYARVIAMKCRGASSLLRDVYLAADKPWAIDPPEDPDIPANITESIKSLVMAELGKLGSVGVPVDPSMIRDRTMQLMDAARQAAKKAAEKRAQIAEDKIEELLVDGGFYKALAEFLVDLPLFPFACIKGPVVRIVPVVTWVDGAAKIDEKPKLFWNRVSPFDLWWTPGAADIEDAETIERSRLTRADLNDLLDLPGYNTANILKVLDEYGRGGLADVWESTDTERALQESRENPRLNKSGLIDCMEYNGRVQGRLLREYGMTPEQVPDEMRDYAVQCWVIGRYVIKAQFSPSPRKRHPYFVTSFEKVPGTPVGNALPDVLADIQQVCNATLRSLVNNLSIASGPQAVINDDRLSEGEDGEDMFPWKRWHTRSDPMGNNSQVPISFFQPTSNAQELLLVYKSFNDIADELSAIPKYQTGSGTGGGGAGRTAAGLAMLMTNASKILQTVAANIDRDVFEPLLTQLFDMMMLTDTTGVLQGDESVRVMGVNVAVQRETQRARQLEFLQITANPIDAQIVGPHGRAAVLRAVSDTIGLPGEDIVPSEEKLAAMEQQQQAMQQQEMAAAGGQAEGNKPQQPTQDTGPRQRLTGGAG
jgi:hypothetical protein